MPNTREKLIELVVQGNIMAFGKSESFAEIIADNLIANGVTVQSDKDINVPNKWIPVTERLPEDIYGKDREKIVVLVCTESGNVSQCARIADYDCSTDAKLTQVKWTKNGEFYWSKGKRVTHWMPLPEPPKGE